MQGNATEIEMLEKDGRYSIQFRRHGRQYRTNWTSYYDEAIVWRETVDGFGWCVSARPNPTGA